MTEPTATSPSASGPAGALFEGQVGAHYLLTMLAEADPRGLPGVLTERVELQRAGEGHPLDDVIVRGVTNAGLTAVLEIQVKRTVTFAPGDAVFKDVVAQLAAAFPKLDLTHDRHQFAVATERMSFKITGPYQDVLRWAREVSSASTFAERINRKKVGNDDMRAFVATVRAHLAAVGCANDDETVWHVLRRFQILTFDYDAPGSQSVELALERARHVLAPEDVERASALWKVLTETAIRAGASGGDLDRDRLVADLAGAGNFRLLGTRSNRLPRETLSEAALLAAADLRRCIAGATLARSAQLDAVRAARDGARYIEIRGGPGVGKSGLLGLLVQQVLAEGRAVVLTPERTVAGGWLALKSALGVEVSPQAFLSDLASDGGAVLFVDSLDFFNDAGKRATVVDLVRSAAEVPGFQVIATARTGFDKEEPNWLPADVLNKLGRAPPLVVEELGTEEIEELKAAAPALRALLAENHPARAIARNLFRLSRLLEVRGSTDELRSEVDLLERWWSTADGAPEGRRDRARLLSDLSDAVLGGADHLETRAAPAAIDALIASESLRELGLDRVGFRHDVLREWGMAARLHDDPSRLDRLPLTRPVSTSLARGVELGARLVLERAGDGTPWLHFLGRVSPADAHASWRRFALLAILRSELAFQLLERASATLFEGDGALLRELIRTAIAAESRPLVEMLAEVGPEVPSIPADIYGPVNGSWARLAHWLLLRRADLPLQALPDIVELFQSLSLSMFVSDPLTPSMAAALADWLQEIESARDYHPLAKDQPRFATAFRNHGLFKLADDVRHAFALMAARVPDRARAYLQGVLKRQNREQTIRDIMKFQGAFARAAPSELAELTLAGLIAKPDDDKRHYRRPLRRDIFTHLDTDFLPSSPAQGPFLELLNAAPQHGLTLIRRLVDHAVAGMSDAEPGDDSFELALPGGPRFFPWQYTYYWARDAQGCYAIESALMALEAWSHVRIERGDALDEVIADILGPVGSPAAFVLVAVDVLISHWPKTLGAIKPFLGSPELLAVDRRRQAHDSMPDVDLLGWGSVGPKEPRGPVTRASLQKRLSRRIPLEYLLGYFTHIEGADLDGLRRVLEAASERLGPPQPDDTFAEPRLMARYALNLIDRTNWQPHDGGMVYISPPDETRHVAELQAKHAPQTADFGMDAAIQNALESAERSGPELAEQAVLYAKRLQDAEAPEDAIGSLTNAVVSAAMIVARDSDNALFDEHEGWVRDVFAGVLDGADSDAGRRMRDGIRFNPVAIATLGLIHVWRRSRSVTDRDLLLELAGGDSTEAAQGFGAGLEVLREIDPRLIPAILRCALTAQIHPTGRWDDDEGKRAADKAQYRERVERAIEADRAWLRGDARMPDWPQFPEPTLHVRRGFRSGGSRQVDGASVAEHAGDEVYAQSAALWVRQLTRDLDRQPADWVSAFVDAFADWTARANGAGYEPHAEIDSHLHEWNSIFFRLLARTLPEQDLEKAVASVTKAITVPDASFFDIAESLVPALDEIYFDDLGFSLEAALRLRELLTGRLTDTVGWRRERDKVELSVEMRIGPAIGVLFFNYYSAFSAAKCYLLPKGIDRVEHFFPQLTQLIEEGPVPFTGLLTMSLLEVSRRPAHATFFLNSALTWLRRQPDNVPLWVNSGLGARLAKWLEIVSGADPSLRSVDHPLRAQLDDVLARLVQMGVAEAHRIEKLLALP